MWKWERKRGGHGLRRRLDGGKVVTATRSEVGRAATEICVCS